MVNVEWKWRKHPFFRGLWTARHGTLVLKASRPGFQWFPQVEIGPRYHNAVWGFSGNCRNLATAQRKAERAVPAFLQDIYEGICRKMRTLKTANVKWKWKQHPVYYDGWIAIHGVLAIEIDVVGSWHFPYVTMGHNRPNQISTKVPWCPSLAIAKRKAEQAVPAFLQDARDGILRKMRTLEVPIAQSALTEQFG